MGRKIIIGRSANEEGHPEQSGVREWFDNDFSTMVWWTTAEGMA